MASDHNLPNILLITADSLRADYCSFINHKIGNTTPFLNKLSQQSLVFCRAYTQGPYTAISFPAIMTGKYPIFLRSPLLGSRVSIAEYLRRRGYLTIGLVSSNPPARIFSGNGRGFFIFKEIKGKLEDLIHSEEKGLFQDFNSFFEILLQKLRRLYSDIIKRTHSLTIRLPLYFYLYWKGRSDIRYLLDLYYPLLDYFILRILEGMIPKLSKLGFPMFIWIHLMSTHYPYGVLLSEKRIEEALALREVFSYQKRKLSILRLIENYKMEDNYTPSNKLKDVVVNAYKNGVRACDEIINKIVKILDDAQFWENGVLILTADHGEELFDHGGYGHRPLFLEEILRIPMMIWNLEKVTHKIIINKIVGNIDIFPTIIKIADPNLSSPLSIKLLKLCDGVPLMHFVAEDTNKEAPDSSKAGLKKALYRDKLISENAPVDYVKIMTGQKKKMEVCSSASPIFVRVTKSNGHFLLVQVFSEKADKYSIKEEYIEDQKERKELLEVALQRARQILLPSVRDQKQDLVYRTLRAAYKII